MYPWLVSRLKYLLDQIALIIFCYQFTVADLGERPGRFPPPLFWVQKEKMTEGKKASRANKSRLGHPLSSRSGSATDMYTCIIWEVHYKSIESHPSTWHVDLMATGLKDELPIQSPVQSNYLAIMSNLI